MASSGVKAWMYRALRILNLLALAIITFSIYRSSTLASAIPAITPLVAGSWKLESALQYQHMRRLNIDGFMVFIVKKLANDYTGTIAEIDEAPEEKRETLIKKKLGDYKTILFKAKAYAAGADIDIWE